MADSRDYAILTVSRLEEYALQAEGNLTRLRALRSTGGKSDKARAALMERLERYLANLRTERAQLLQELQAGDEADERARLLRDLQSAGRDKAP